MSRKQMEKAEIEGNRVPEITEVTGVTEVIDVAEGQSNRVMPL